MFMPSARVWNEMQFEPSGLWPVPINRGDEFALLAKLPTHVIKAAYRGCRIALTLATATTCDGTVLSTVLEICDDPASPLGIAGVHRHPEEQLALNRLMDAEECLFVFFDEGYVLEQGTWHLFWSICSDKRSSMHLRFPMAKAPAN
jgi:hypothetical protein